MMVSLVLGTFGRATELDLCIGSLAAQRCKDFELLIVDQNVDERLQPHVEHARSVGLAVRHLRLNKPSLSNARNVGVAQANGSVVGFPDDDCWYEPEVIANVRSALTSHPEWDGVVAQWVEQNAARVEPPREGDLDLQRWRRFDDGDASSICLFFRTALVRRLGGFDTRLGVGQWYGAGEETDLLLTALASGARLGRCAAIRVHHRLQRQPQRTPQAWRAALRRARGTGALYIKHRLEWWVIARGLLAPPVKGLRQGPGWHGLTIGIATSAGRLQGALRWWLRERRGAPMAGIP